MKKYLISASFVFLISFMFLLSSLCFAGECKVFGKNYEREIGEPQAVIDTFTINFLDDECILKVYNGGLEDDEVEYVSSTEIFINNFQVVGSNNINQNVSSLEVPLNDRLSLGDNSISVEVRGKPGGMLTVSIISTCPYTDADGDGFTIEGGTWGPKDCDDTNQDINPIAKEICDDGIDQDCNGGDLPCILEDVDGDLWAEAQGDCDDSNPDIFPGATDMPVNGIDEDCDGQDSVSPRLADMDFDNYTAEDGDCNDKFPQVYPGATEIPCNGIDEDCDGFDLCDLTPTIEEESGFIDGEVFDSRTKNPLEGAVIKMANVGQLQTDAQGRFSIPTPKEGVYLILIEKQGYNYAQRRIRVETGHDFAVEPVYLTPIDAVSVTITPEAAGTLINSTNDVELHFESGSVAAPIEVSATRYYANREFPSDLPPTSQFTTAVELLPDGLTLEKPVRLLVENTLDFAPGTPVPVGYYRKDLGRWVPDGMGKITDDGQYMEYYITHFSPYDLNFPVLPPENSQPPTNENTNNKSNKPNSPSPSCTAGVGGQSKVIYRDGELMEDYQLPTYKSLGKSNALTLIYTSSSADPKPIFSLEYDLQSAQMFIPEKVEYKVNIGGKIEKGVYLGDEGKMSPKYMFDSINFQGERLSTGWYPYCIELINWYGYYYNLARRFGDPALGYAVDSQGNLIKGTQADFPERKKFDGNIIINNQINSPIGAGWNIAELDRIYSTPYSDSVILISGSGGKSFLVGKGRIIETFAGGGSSGDGVPATQASLNNPRGVTVDNAGNIYIADRYNHSVRRVDPSGIITTVAGNGIPGYSGDGGPATQASLNNPYGLAVDDNTGNIYIADSRNYCVRRVDPSGIITTVAGNGIPGYSGDGGPAIQANLLETSDVDIDNAGNIYIADPNNYRIRCLDPSGIITTIAGNGIPGYSGDGGPAIQASLNEPSGVAVDSTGNIYIADSRNNRIRRVDPSGIITTVAGNGIPGYSGDEKPAIQASLNKPSGVAVDSAGNIYIADTNNCRIHRVDPSGIISTIAGNGIWGYSGDGGPSILASLSGPSGVAVDSAGNIYIADTYNNRIRIILKRVGIETEYTSPEGDYSVLARRHDDGTYTRTMKDGTIYHFNADGLQTSRVDRNDQTTTYNYDTDNRLIGITDPVGLVTTLTYSGNNLSSITDPAGRTTQFVHDAENNLTSIIAPDSTTTGFTYDSRHLMSFKTDPLGRTTQYNYNAHGMIESVIGPDGNSNQYSPSDGEGLINDLPDGVGTYDNPTTALPPQDAIHTDPEANISYIKADKYGRILSETDALGNVTTYERGCDCGGVTAIHQPNGTTIQKDYDEVGNPISSTDAEGNTTTSTYESSFNNVKTITDPLGRVTTFNYDENGNLIQTIDPLGNTTTLTYYSNGLVHTHTNAIGATTTYEYDAFGNLIKEIDALGNETIYTYDTAGNRTSVTDASGNTTFYQYDIMNNLVGVTDPAGGNISYAYDAKGNRISMTDVNGNTTQYQYDSRDRLIRIIDPLGNESNYTYDYDGKILTKTDSKGATTTYEYDALGRLIKETDPLGSQTIYAYDSVGNLISLTDANGQTTYFTYNKNGQKTSETRPMGQKSTYSYDAVGNLSTVIDAKDQMAVYTYNEMGMKTSVSYYNTYDSTTPQKTVAFTYDDLGNLTSYNDGITSATYTYDILSHKTDETLNYGAFTLSHSYAYNADGTKQSLTYPDGISYTYSYTNGQLNKITIPGVGDIAYTDFQWLSPTKVHLPGGTVKNLVYGQLMRLEQLHVQDSLGTNLMDYTYTRDGVGNITNKVTEHGDYSYAYDNIYQLLSADNPGINDEAYTYDNVSNRLTDISHTGNWIYNSNNQLIGFNGVSYQYDNNGSAIQKNDNGVITNYFYNLEDRLERVEDGSGTLIATYYYDPMGRRLKKDAGGVVTYYSYSDEGLIGEHDASGNEIKTYGYIPDSTWTTDPVFMKEGGNYYYYLNDHLGTSQMILDGSGSVMWAAKYSSFGKVEIEPAFTVTNNLRFPGQYEDAETGLYYNFHRYYDPVIGRYLTQDTSGFAGGDLNLYRYVHNRPINNIDPKGLTNNISTGVYFCSEGLIPDNYQKNPLRFFTFSEFPHSWICINEKCRGLMPASNPSGGEITSAFAYFDSTKCKEMMLTECCDRQIFIECVDQKINIQSHPYNWLFGPNCDSWAQGVIISCQIKACQQNK